MNGQTGGAGGAFDWNIGSSAFSLRGLYLAGNGNQPTASTVAPFTNRGLFGDPYQATAELEFATKNAAGEKPFALKLLYTNGSVNNTTVNSGGVNAEWAFSKKIAVFGRYGFGTLDFRTNAAVPVASATTPSVIGVNAGFAGTSLSPQTWMFGFSFADLFKEGATGGIAIGQPLIESKIGNATQTNLEAFYSFPVSSNIKITPDVQFIFNPNNNSTNSSVFVGTLRTVFSF